MTILLVVTMIVFFLAIDWAVRRREARNPVVETKPLSVAPQPIAMRYPQGIFFTKSHTWLNLFPTGVVRLGVDDFVSRLMKQPALTFLKSEGEHIGIGEPLLQLSEGAHTLTVRSPLNGTVLRLNDELAGHPEHMREALFSDGWAFSIQPDSVRDLRWFLIGDESHSWIREELGRLRDFLAGASPELQTVHAFMQDGGLSMEGVLNGLDAQGWKRFESEFLSVEK